MATLAWIQPTQNTDGTPLTDLAGYRIYYGTALGSYPSSVRLDNPGLTGYVVTPLLPATWFFVVTAFDTSGNESAYSNVATKAIPGDPGPGPVARLPADPSVAPIVTCVACAPPTFARGYAFRFSAAFVPTAAGDVAVLGERYPTARGDGWEAPIETRDRSSSAPPRLAGQHQLSVGGAAEVAYRVDVPRPGRYRVRLAAGDATYDNRARFELRDGATVLYTQPERVLSVGQFVDAGGVTRTLSSWESDNQPRDVTLATTTFRFVLLRPIATSSVIAFLSLEALP